MKKNGSLFFLQNSSYCYLSRLLCLSALVQQSVRLETPDIPLPYPASSYSLIHFSECFNHSHLEVIHAYHGFHFIFRTHCGHSESYLPYFAEGRN